MEHGHGIGDDLPLMTRLATRRNAIRTLGGLALGGVALGVAGLTAGPAGPPRRATSPRRVGGLFVDPEETGGPFPADGSNRSDGPTSNVLTDAGVVRRDITRSFVGSGAAAAGIPMDVELTLLGVDRGGAPLAGHAVYVWHCDATGTYSLYGDGADESWLRGVQVADDAGRVRFRTVVPGAYDGRWPHMHLEVHRSVDAMRAGRRRLLTTQVALPGDFARRVYGDGRYAGSAANLSRTPLARDMVFGDNSAGEIAQQTLSIRPDAGVPTGSATVGLAGTA